MRDLLDHDLGCHEVCGETKTEDRAADEED